MSSTLYFAYGSNMCSRRLQLRVPSARPMGIAKLPGYRLQFHKKGQDGSAKADCEFTRNESHHVWGVIYSIRTAEKVALDNVEGLGVGYNGHLVTLALGEQAVVAATYVAAKQAIVTGLRPYGWYLAHCVRGAREHQLPRAYTAMVEAVESDPDPDPARHAREMAISTSAIASGPLRQR